MARTLNRLEHTNHVMLQALSGLADEFVNDARDPATTKAAVAKIIRGKRGQE
jgi:hypothetical protein